MIRLALRSLRHDWRRALPAVLAIAVAGLLMLMQLALALGAFASAAAVVTQSAPAIWVGPREARAPEESAGLAPEAAAPLWIVPGVARIEPLSMLFAEIAPAPRPGAEAPPEDARTRRAVMVVPVATAPEGLLYARVLPPALRAALAEPDTVALDPAEAARLGVAPGDRVRVDRATLRLAGLAEGLRGLGLTTALVSEATGRRLAPAPDARPAFYLLAPHAGTGARAGAGAGAEEVAALVAAIDAHPALRGWTAEALAESTVRMWMLESGAGVIFLASSAVALGVALLVVSQTLTASVAASTREYAALRAYGIGFGRLQRLVAAQGGLMGCAALALAAAAAAALILALRARGVPAVLGPGPALLCAVGLAAVILLSNLLALRRLRRADPAALLR